MKKYISLLLAAVVTACCLSGCGQKISNTQTNENGQSTEISENDSQKMKVVTTIFPEYDWVKQIAGEEASNLELTMLLDNGVDLHSYQPTADDIMKISECDLFIYVGGESDAWVEDALKEAVNKNMKVINLLDVLGNTVKEEEVVEGMQTEEEESEEGPEYDEHVWLSLKNAKVLCKAIADDLADIDAENAHIYQSNEQDYVKKLDDLDKQYQEVVDASSQKTLIFGDRFPFRYMVDDYGLSYYAAFVGCSAETEASFETITFLAKKTDELGIRNIMTIEKSDQKIAKTIIDNTKDKNQNILTLNSMQSTTSDDVKNGTTYFSVMEDNLEVLEEALQ
ncbi:zinc ABC transporter substrate-binding protein [Roseburia sp. MUC/MUC-530-WT-4D]|uniref:Zinc ABC transporter substrate-binding protein n=1 Tax=Roseburia porci TaxID=2605790 RepID=A0A6L5YVP7_9FIRM|nr:metal ABC transporter substrate-binding protein [Roseburia porci]MCI5518131.1 metal ABC transporter substrate-binding protein [Roseburia sp.]MST76022.1 zinc ABC transporter substrate-binding protein [Roseburia porci]